MVNLLGCGRGITELVRVSFIVRIRDCVRVKVRFIKRAILPCKLLIAGTMS